jgi:hypothetical protein
MERLQEHIVQRAETMYVAASGPALWVALSFSLHWRLAKPCVPSLARQLANLVSKASHAKALIFGLHRRLKKLTAFLKLSMPFFIGDSHAKRSRSRICYPQHSCSTYTAGITASH